MLTISSSFLGCVIGVHDGHLVVLPLVGQAWALTAPAGLQVAPWGAPAEQQLVELQWRPKEPAQEQPP